MTYWENIMLVGIKSVLKKICSKYVYNKNFLKNKIKPYSGEATDFHNKKYISLALIILAKEQSV